MIHPLRTQFEKVLRPVYNHVIGGRHPAVRGDAQYMPVECKYTGKSVARVVLASGAETQRALEEAHGAREAMQELKSYERKRALLAIAKGVETRAEELAGAICWEVGKPMRDAVGGGGRAGGTFTIAA